MSTWGGGYVDDGSYIHGFYRELTPTLLALLALMKRQRSPDPNAPLTYCELGSGLGLSLNLLAAANPQITFNGNDFNPSHILESRSLAAEAGSENIRFYEQSFEEFVHESSLPATFDIIALHGIYSWISPENRAHIVEFIKRKLAPGGLLYISYNALPGWSSQMPLQRLLFDHASTQSGPMVDRVQSAVAFADKLKETDAAYFRHTPHAVQRLAGIHQKPRTYVAHEYFNQQWTPFYHADVVRELGAAKLSYLGSAALLENNDGMFLTPEIIKVIAEVKDPTLRETVRDYAAYLLFRRDVFVRGPLPLAKTNVEGIWLDRGFALMTPRGDVPMRVENIPRDVRLRPEIYNPILDRLADSPATIRQLLASPTISGFGATRVIQAIETLAGMGHVQPCLADDNLPARIERTKAFNHAICHRARSSGDIQFLASPVTGGGVSMTQMSMLILMGLNQQPSDVARFVNSALKAQGLNVLKDGKPLPTEEGQLAEIQIHIDELRTKHSPVWRHLKVM